jgi:hypothetical protein
VTDAGGADGADNADVGGAVPDGPDHEITLSWIRAYPGVVAYAPLPPSGRYPRDGRGRPRPRLARLRAADPIAAPRPPDQLLSDSDWSWVIRGEHRWSSVSARFGPDAPRIMLELAAAGCVTIGYALEGNALAQPPRRVYPHLDLAAAAAPPIAAPATVVALTSQIRSTPTRRTRMKTPCGATRTSLITSRP